ncbi:MAG: LysE family transporter [bacterium]|nr:LysE family transporter [bacterium]
MNFILIFLASVLASFIGSLQLGPVNIFVINTALNKNRTNAYWVAFGGVIPEFIYCGLAVYCGSYFINNPGFFLVFKILLIILLFTVGVIYFFKKHKPVELQSLHIRVEGSKSQHFMKGFALAGLNPQLLPYWMFVMVYFNSIKFLILKSEIEKLAYIFGAGFGAFCLLLLIIITIDRFKEKVLKYINNKYYYKVLSILFIAIAIQQLIKL